MRTVHRASASGTTRCGKPGVVSVSGVFVSCPECIALDRQPSREEALAELHRVALEFRAKKEAK